MSRATVPDAWRESEILGSFSDAVVVIDAGWRLGYVNAEAGHLLQRSPADLVGLSLWTTYPDLRGTAVEDSLRRARSERRSVAVLNRYEPLNAWFSVKASPLRDGLLVSFHDVSELKQAELETERLAAELAALHRIADRVARRTPTDELFAHVAREAAALQRVEGAAIARRIGSDRVQVVGLWSSYVEALTGTGGIHEADGPFGELFRDGYALIARAGDGTLSAEAIAAGRKAMLQVPITAQGEPWGVLILSSSRVDAFDDGALERQAKFADLVSVAISDADARDRLAQMAATDPLSGLANHRVFHGRLREEIEQSERLHRPLSIAVLDIDRFSDVNDMHGHLAGDRILAEVGRRLAAIADPGQLLARVGGDEFALILPGHSPERAATVVERARAAVADRPFGIERAPLTVSAGVADLASAGYGELLFACADGALFWSKLNGRDVVCTFHPALMNELSPADRAEALVRAQTLAGITALARAIDAKDPLTRRHSERVAWLAELLARECGWSEPDMRALHEAALVHDVGKIGIPDEILLNDGRLTDAQYALVRQHAALSAEIVEGVLTPRQVAWVRSHHERPDGRGYPEGLTDAEIPVGASLLSVADVLDVMTISRPYSSPIPLVKAVAEIRRLVGAQFAAEPAEALQRLYEAGALSEWDVAPERDR